MAQDVKIANIRKLDISFCELKNHAVEVAKELVKLPSLETVNFALNNLKEHAALVLEELAKSKTLKNVDFSGNDLAPYVSEILEIFTRSNILYFNITENHKLLDGKRINSTGYDGLIEAALQARIKEQDKEQLEYKINQQEEINSSLPLPDSITHLIGEYAELEQAEPEILF